MDLGLKGRTAVITGGSKGIGLGIARAFAAEGVKVALLARGKDDLERAAEAIRREFKLPVLAIPTDITTTESVRAAGVEIVDSIPRLLEKVDVVFIESVDGRIHLQEAIPVILAGKPLFIDKPAAGTLADAVAIYELAKKHNVPCFSSSSLRFTPGIAELSSKPELGRIVADQVEIGAEALRRSRAAGFPACLGGHARFLWAGVAVRDSWTADACLSRLYERRLPLSTSARRASSHD